MAGEFALDHVVIAVSDLDAGIRTYERLGFEVRDGGVHPGNGTCNVIMRFGLDYLELLGVSDAALADRRDRGRELLAFLGRVESGLISFSLRVEGADDADLRSMPGTLVSIPLRRHLPSGGEFEWEMVVPGTSNCHRPWPFFTKWGTPAETRLALEPPGKHPNGSVGFAAVATAAWSIGALTDLYARFGLRVGEPVVDPLGGLDARVIDLADAAVELVSPNTVHGPLGQTMAREGEGPHAVMIRVASLADTAAYLARNGVRVYERAGGLLVDPDDACNTRVLFVDRRRPTLSPTWTGTAYGTTP